MLSDDLRLLRTRNRHALLYTCIKRRFKQSQRIALDVYYVQGTELIRIEVPESRYYTPARHKWGGCYLVGIAPEEWCQDTPDGRLVRDLGLLAKHDSTFFAYTRM